MCCSSVSCRPRMSLRDEYKRVYTAVVRLGIRNIIFNINPRIPRRGPAPAFRTHVNNSGNILTAWRILRCIPRFFLFPLPSFFLQSLSPLPPILSLSLLLVFRHSFRWLELRAEIQRYRSVSIPPCFIFRAVKVDLSWRGLLESCSFNDRHGTPWEWFHLSIKYQNLPPTAELAG